MPSKRKPATAELNVPKELLDQLVKGPMTQDDLDAMFRSLKKAVIERAMNAELSDHLGYEPGEEKPEEQSNHRNGASGKTVITDEGPLRIEVPRDREGSFEPLLIGKHERRFTGFDQKIVAMYARGMTVREIQGYLLEMYGTEVSPEFISKVTDEVLGRGRGLAEPAARADVSGGVLRRAAGEDPRRRGGAQQGGVSGAWRAARRQPRRAGALDRADRRGEVLAEGVQRPEDPRRATTS